MFGRNRSDQATGSSGSSPAPEHPHREGAKNRPTPKRREAQAARRRPLVQDPKTARQREREARRADAARRREAMLAGEESALQPRDRGPERRYVRDVVDGRFGVGEILLPLMLVILVVSAFATSQALTLYLFIYLLMLFAIIDAIVLWFRTKPKLRMRFGDTVDLHGLAWYQALRTFQYRGLRVPRPAVSRGQQPRD